MIIQSVSINGYKNLSKVKIKFDKITALVSLNNFGKSNVLSGIDFAISFIKASSDVKRNMMSNLSCVPLKKANFLKNFKYSMILSTLINEKKYLISYSFEFEWQKGQEHDPKILSESLKMKLDEKGQKYTQLIDRKNNASYYKSSETGRCSSEINIGSCELIVNKLKAYDNLFYKDIISEINEIKIYIENNLEVRENFLPNPIIRKDFENELINADNLPRIIFTLKNKYPDKYSLLINIFTQIFPDIKQIEVKEVKYNNDSNNQFDEDAIYTIANTIYVLFIYDDKSRFPLRFDMLSDGTKRIFMILTKVILSSISNIALIAIEEPENSIHPSLFRAYLEILSDLLFDCKIIIATHSPYVISYLNPLWIHVGIDKNDGLARFYPINKAKEKQLEKDAEFFKMNTGDYLFSLLADPSSDISSFLECDSDE